MRSPLLFLLLAPLAFPQPAWAQEAPAAAPATPPADGSSPEALPDVRTLLTALDENMTFDTRRARMKMVVEGKRRTRTFEMISYGRGEEDSAIEYLSPRREKGTRMLKLGDELWLFMPSVDRVQKVSGHMLRQGMMGSDLSYEDMMSSRELADRYDAKITGQETLDGEPCWVIELKAKDPELTYPKRVTWVQKSTRIPVKQELYALSGMLLKTWTMSDVKTFEGGRRFPTKMEIRDHVNTKSVTRVEFTELEFKVSLPEEVFSLRWLERR